MATFPIRYTDEGGEQAIGRLNRIGQVGETALNRLRLAAEPVPGKLRLIDDAAGKLGTGLNFAKGAILGFVGALSVDAVAGAATRALDYAGGLGELSQQLGVSTKNLQIYQFAAGQAGVSQAELEAGLSRLTRQIGEAAAGNAAARESFSALGVSVTDATGNIRSTDAVLRDVADGLASISDPAKRARLEVDLFGRAGQRLDPILASGSAGLDAVAQAAQRLGVVLSDEMIAKADIAADRLGALGQVMRSQFAVAVTQNADTLLRLADAFGAVIGKIGDFLTWLDKVEVRKNALVSGKTLDQANAMADLLTADYGSGAANRRRGSLRRGQAAAARGTEEWADKILDQVAAKTDRAKAATLEYQQAIADLRREFLAGAISQQEFYDGALAATQRRDAQTKKQASGSASADRAARELDAAYERLISRYDALAAAEARRAEMLADIAKLQQAGRISADTAGQWSTAAATDYYDGLYGDASAEVATRLERAGDQAMDALAKKFEVDIPRSSQRAWDEFQSQGLVAIDAIGELIGGKLGRKISQIAGLLNGLSTGDFRGAGGSFGAILTLGNALGGSSVGSGFGAAFGVGGVFDKLSGTLDKLGASVGFAPNADAASRASSAGIGGFLQQSSLGQVFGRALGGAASGAMADGLVKALGLKGSATGGMIGGAIGSMFGPLGGAVGGFLGSLVGGLFKKTAKSSATIVDGAVTSTTGTSAKRRNTASGLATSVVGSIDDLVDELGGTLGSYRVSIGTRKKTYRVDTSGQGRTKNMPSFETAEEAVAYAVLDAIKDGAISGLGPEVERALKSATSDNLDDVLSAVKIYQSINDQLAEIADPTKYPFDQLNKEFDKYKRQLEEFGLSTVNLEVLRQEKLRELAEKSVANVQAVIDDLTSGSSAGLTDQAAFEAAQAKFFGLLQNAAATPDQIAEAAAKYSEANITLNASSAERFDLQQEIVAALEGVKQRTLDTYTAAGGTSSDVSTSNVTAALAAVEQTTANGAQATVDQLVAIKQQLASLNSNLTGGAQASTAVLTGAALYKSLRGFV